MRFRFLCPLVVAFLFLQACAVMVPPVTLTPLNPADLSPTRTTLETLPVTPMASYFTRAAFEQQTATVYAATAQRWTPTPSVTRRPPTLTPTITLTPTRTATFDPQTIRTATPAQAAICPQVTPGPVATPVLEDENNYFVLKEEDLLAFLNQYGPQPFLMNQFDSSQIFQDLTHDGVPEFVFSGNSMYIFGCQNGQYIELAALPPDIYLFSPEIKAIKDLNKNGVPELYILIARYTQGGHDYRVLEWDGNQFRDLLDVSGEYSGDDRSVLYLEAGYITFDDVDQDGMQELVAVSGLHDRGDGTDAAYNGGPWRKLQTYYRWNGTHFVYFKKLFAQPVYRFQAVLDGDQATIDGDLDRALDLYQQAIFSDELDWWSWERMMVEKLSNSPNPQLPPSDPFEYPNLAAYSRYRIMLIHLARGYQSDALTVFNTLQKLFPPGEPGHAYAEMAQTFWDEYTGTQNMARSCDKAIQFATAHPEEIFTYLESSAYGWQRIEYQAQLEMLCPFQ